MGFLNLLTGPGGGGGGGGTTGTLAEILAAGPPAANTPVGILDHNGDAVRSAYGDGSIWTHHPGRGWSIPTEMLEEGSYGFELTSGTLTSGEALGEKIVYDVTASNAPALKWNCAETVPNGSAIVLKVSLSVTGAVATGAEICTSLFVDTGGLGIGGGLERVSFGWKASVNNQAGSVALDTFYYLLESALPDVEVVGFQIYPKAADSGTAGSCNAWCNPNTARANPAAFKSAATYPTTNLYGGESAKFAQTANVHPGSGGDATVTIHEVLILEHPTGL